MLQTGRSKGAKEKQTTLQWQLDVKTFKVAVVEPPPVPLQRGIKGEALHGKVAEGDLIYCIGISIW